MSFIENVLALIDRNGISKNKMLKDLGLAKGSISNWQERGTVPSGETLSKIAAYFGVSVDYLLGNNQKNKPSSEEENLSDIDKEVLRRFRSLDATGRRLALAQLDTMLSVQKDSLKK